MSNESDLVTDEELAAARERPAPVASRSARSSLRERMRVHREELESRTTEIFPVPRWMSILAVELKPVPWAETEESMTRNLRRPDTTTLNTACDEIVAGTVGFYEIREDGGLEEIEDAGTWSEIAQAYNDKDFGSMPATLLERVALVDLCSDQGAMTLSTNFRRWMGGAKTGISEEVERDFGTTS